MRRGRLLLGAGRMPAAVTSSTTVKVGLVLVQLLLLFANADTLAQQQQPKSNRRPTQQQKDGAPASSTTTKPGMVSIPLVPHHVVRQRHLEATGMPLEKVERPTHSKYHYMNEQKQNTDDKNNNIRNLREPDAFEADQIAGLFQGFGTHYADLWCGTPPQRQTVIVDTGSGVTAFPCTGCTQCGVPDYHIDALFDESTSTTYRKLGCSECLKGNCRSNECSIGMSYAEGSSWSAHEVADLCYAGGFHNRPVDEDDGASDDLDPFHAPAFAFETKFGCQTKVTGLFKTQLADGIMGMDVASASFWKQMYVAGKIGAEAFSLCFSRKDEAARTGTESGAMSLGGTDDRLHETPMVYSATQQSSGFYVVHLRKVYLRHGGGGTSAVSSDPGIPVQTLDISEKTLNSGRVIVDSGTTDTYFSRRLQGPFEAAYKEITGQAYGHGVKKFTEAELAQEPTILFQLSGDEDLNQVVVDAHGGGTVAGLAGDLDPEHPLDVILAIPPEHYYEYDPDVNGYVSRFYVDESSGGVLGANSMMGHDVYFDVTNFRIGWSESSCDYTALVAQYTDPDWTPPEPAQPERIEPTEEQSGDHVVAPSDSGDVAGNEEPSGNYGQPGPPFCSSMGCQVGMIVGVVFTVTLLAVKLIRRAPAGPIYEVADSELELQPASFVDEARGSEFRDHDEEGEFT